MVVSGDEGSVTDDVVIFGNPHQEVAPLSCPVIGGGKLPIT